MSNYIGVIPGKGSLVKQKRQRKKGGSKNVYLIGMDLSIVNAELVDMLTKFGGEKYMNRPNAYLFTKRPAAEKAWAWFVLRYA